MRLGLFGGTFDPVHAGHLDVARAARKALDLDVVWLVPAREPPHRAIPKASAAHRFAMAAMAVAGEDGLRVSDLEMDVAGPSYTVDTLDRLRAGGMQGASVFVVTGADAFRDIPTWRAFPELLDQAHFVVISRPGAPVSDLRQCLPMLADRMVLPPWQPRARPGIFLVDVPTAPVSSTDIRRAIAEGAPLKNLVPAGIADHISRHGLYASHPLSDGTPERPTA
ncbi:MAG: nicotinate-nucleotide adenylyltransferase [Vicinamibacterales bacterium]